MRSQDVRIPDRCGSDYIWKKYENKISCFGQTNAGVREAPCFTHCLLVCSRMEIQVVVLYSKNSPRKAKATASISPIGHLAGFDTSNIQRPIWWSTDNVRITAKCVTDGSSHQDNSIPNYQSINVQASLVGDPASTLLEYSPVRTSRGHDILIVRVVAHHCRYVALSTIDKMSLSTRVARCETVCSVPAAQSRDTRRVDHNGARHRQRLATNCVQARSSMLERSWHNGSMPWNSGLLGANETEHLCKHLYCDPARILVQM